MYQSRPNHRFQQGNDPNINNGVPRGAYQQNHIINTSGNTDLSIDSHIKPVIINKDVPVIDGISTIALPTTSVSVTAGELFPIPNANESFHPHQQTYANINAPRNYPAAPSPNTNRYSSGPPHQYIMDASVQNLIGKTKIIKTFQIQIFKCFFFRSFWTISISSILSIYTTCCSSSTMNIIIFQQNIIKFG